MATTTLATPNRQRSSIFLRFLLAFGTVLVLALVAVALLIYSIGRSELPQVDGTLAVAGLSAPVSVVRDKLGVPHIRAASYDDLLFAQGFVRPRIVSGRWIYRGATPRERSPRFLVRSC